MDCGGEARSLTRSGGRFLPVVGRSALVMEKRDLTYPGPRQRSSYEGESEGSLVLAEMVAGADPRERPSLS